MTVVAVASVRGSPGATTVALGLASMWPAPERVFVEADPAGGVVAARRGLAHDPGLVTLAASRQDGEIASLAQHAHDAGDGLLVVCGPASADPAYAALAVRGEQVRRAIGAATAPVVVDVGRVDSRSPALPLVGAADVVCVVARPRLEEIEHVIGAVAMLGHRGVEPRLLLVGERPYAAGEVAAVLDGVRVEVLPVDPRGAAECNGDHRRGRFAQRRAPLARALHALASELASCGAAPAAEVPA